MRKFTFFSAFTHNAIHNNFIIYNKKERFVKQTAQEPLVGFEPTTPRLQITCSGQLSYIGKVLVLFFKGAAKV